MQLSTSPDRVRTPLRIDLERLGTIRPRNAAEVGPSNWTLGCETLDRDFADWDKYRDYLAPLGINMIRLQAGWAKCERVRGTYDFAWLDPIVDAARTMGVDAMLETGYGNPIYPGGGGFDLAGGFPTSPEALAAWDAWVDAMSRHVSGRVRDWAMWNEPDLQPGDGSPRKTPEQIAAFNVRTAKIILSNIPDARLAGLSLATSSPAYLEQCLAAMGPEVALFRWFIYHGYGNVPESTRANVEGLKAVVAKFNPAAKMRQGESGCPSEMATRFALSGIAWSEYSQAKWDIRRMLDDLGHDVESSVFTFCDFNHKGREINLKGLLRADEEHNVVAVKRAYYAVQNVVSVFDGTLSRVADTGFGTKDATLTTYEFRKADGRRVFVFWQHAEAIERQDKEDGSPGHGGCGFRNTRPGDSFETRPAVFRDADGIPLADPVWVDLLTGRVYAFPHENVVTSAGVVRYLDVPVYDSPCVLAERDALGFE